MKAKEEMNYQQVKELLKNKIQKIVDAENTNDWKLQLATKLGVYEAMMDLLIMENPFQSAEILHLAEFRYIITRFKSENDIYGEVVANTASEAACNYNLKFYEMHHPEYKYVKSIKIVEK